MTAYSGLARSSPSRLSTWAAVAVVVGLVLLFRVAGDLIGLMALGATLAYLFVPVVDRLERRGLGRTAGTALVLVVLLAVVVLVAVLAAPAVADQALSLQRRWASGELLELATEVERSLADALPMLEPGQLGLVPALRQAMRSDTGPLIVYVPDLFEAIGNAVLVPFVLFALLRDGPVLRRRLLSTVPNQYFEFAMNVAYKADAHLGGYLRGQALIALLVGASTALGLGILGVDYYLVLGLVTGLANFVPYVGFAVSAALSVSVAIVTSGDVNEAVLVLVLYGVLQTVENIVFQPWITGRNVAMHPVLVLLAILVGGRTAGVLGMTLAVPAAAILKVLVVETATNLRRYHL